MLLLLRAYAILLLWTRGKLFSVSVALAHDANASAAASGFSLGNRGAAETFDSANSSLARTQFPVLDKPSTAASGSDSQLAEATRNSSSRSRRQLYLQPNVGYLPSFVEGAKCITTRGVSGSCVAGIRDCHPYQRHGRHLALLRLGQWAFTRPSFQPEYCTFYNHFGWPNTGICCTNELSNALGSYDPSDSRPSLVQPPLQQPTFIVGAERPTQEEPPSLEAPTGEENHEGGGAGLGVEEEFSNADVDGTSGNIDPAEDLDSDVLEISADRNNGVHNSISEAHEEPATVVIYDDFRYQWPHFTEVQQLWPPPLPTHPPAIGNWPPPIPTHPPNHHYPTHPPGSQDTSAVISTQSTTRKTSTSLRPTTRRPNRPIYPAYPIYPPSGATPTKPRPRPPVAATSTSTTRRPPTPEAASAAGLPPNCGLKNAVSPDQERIVGGSNASPNEFPWIAVLFRAGRQFCGGSLITSNHILTAAHCVARMNSWDVAAITVHLGDYDIRNSFEVKHVERRVKRLVRHKGFQFSTLHNDVAILTLSEPVRFSHEVQPVCLPTSVAQQTRSYSGHVATVAGWGSLHENGPQPSVLQKVSIPIWSNADCARQYGRAAPAGIISSMLCAGQTARDSCSGDSGGPLIVNEAGRYTQVGIVSWGIGCGKGHYPGVYTRVTSLLPWIYKNIRP